MLSLDDPKWSELKGGYKVLYSPVSALRQLEAGVNTAEAWKELWNDLHHQGDVGEASYAAVPHLARIHATNPNLDWNLYGIVALIEIERRRKTNPPMPAWLETDYAEAWRKLTMLAIEDLRQAVDRTTVQVLLACIALGKGAVVMGTIIGEFTEDEWLEILDKYLDWSNLYRVAG
jgi:hypothetical protein